MCQVLLTRSGGVVTTNPTTNADGYKLYSFTNNNSEDGYYEITFAESGIAPIVYKEDSSGAVTIYTRIFPTAGRPNQYFVENGTTVVIAVMGTANTSFTLTISDFLDKEGETWQTAFKLVDETENDGTKYEVEHTAKIGKAGDADFYVFTPLDASWSYKIYTTGTTDTMGILYRPLATGEAADPTTVTDRIDGMKKLSVSYDEPLDNGSTTRKVNMHLGYTLEKDKKYYIRVTAQNGTDTGDYTIHAVRLGKLATTDPLYDTSTGAAAEQYAPKDARFGEQWGLMNTRAGNVGNDINALPAWEYSTGSNVIVGVMDTGAEVAHVDLANHMLPGFNFYHNMADVFPANEPSPPAPTTPPLRDQSAMAGHGTHVAGIIAAEKGNLDANNRAIGVVGVAPDARIVPIKMMGNAIPGVTTGVNRIINSVNFAVSSGVNIVNCSYGGGYNSLEEDAFRNASNILFVASSGNDGNDIGIAANMQYPACYNIDNLITVADLQSDGTLSGTSNFGGATHIAAPGTSILSTVPIGGYGYKSGTSMAAPHVAGVAALVWSKYPSLTATQVKDRIVSANNVTQFSGLANQVSSGGLVNALYALSNDATQPRRSLGTRNQEPSEQERKAKIMATMAILGDEHKTDVVLVSLKDKSKQSALFDGSIIPQCSFVEDIPFVDAIAIQFQSIDAAQEAVTILNALPYVKCAEINYKRYLID